MSFDYSSDFDPQIEKLAEAQHISASEALDKIIRVGLDHLLPNKERKEISYASLYGSVNGAGAHGSRQAVDKYINELRSEW